MDDFTVKLKNLPITLNIDYVDSKGKLVISVAVNHKFGEVEDFAIPNKLNEQLESSKAYKMQLAKTMPKHTVSYEDDKSILQFQLNW